MRKSGYGDNYIDNKKELCEQLYTIREQKIKIVNNLDDFCLACLEKKNKNCTNLLFTDAWIAKQYEFDCGQIYSAKELLALSRNKNYTPHGFS